MCRILNLLAEHPDIQNKLRAEILHAAEAQGGDGKLDYDTLMNLPYLEAVCRETFRTYVVGALPCLETTRSPTSFLDAVLPVSLPCSASE